MRSPFIDDVCLLVLGKWSHLGKVHAKALHFFLVDFQGPAVRPIEVPQPSDRFRQRDEDYSSGNFCSWALAIINSLSVTVRLKGLTIHPRAKSPLAHQISLVVRMVTQLFSENLRLADDDSVRNTRCSRNTPAAELEE
jgi:hypothetical protein